MWPVTPNPSPTQANYTHRRPALVHRKFQLKYVRNTLWIFFISSAFAYLPLLFLLNQNYAIVKDILTEYAPDVVQHLEREQVALNLGLVLVFLGQLVFLHVYLRKMTARIVAPVQKLTQFIRQVHRGDHSQKQLKIRQEDEFQELVDTFNDYYLDTQAKGSKPKLKPLEDTVSSKDQGATDGSSLKSA